MMQNAKISTYQFLILVTLFTIGTSILIVPSGLAAKAKHDAWIVAIVGMVIGLVVIGLFCLIAQWFPHLTFIQMNEMILGKWLGKGVSLLFVFMSFIYASSLLFYSGTFLNTHLLPNTPMASLNILMAIIIVMGVHLGLETIARSAEIFILVFFVLFFFLVLFISPEVKFENVQPIFEAGTKTVIQSTFPFIEVTSVNAIVLLMFFPVNVNNRKQASKSFFIGYIIGGIVIIIFTFLSVSVLGAYSTAAEVFPSYELAKRINIGDFIQRIEALMAGLWIIALYFKTTIYFYASVLGIAQILNLKDYRPLIVPLGMIAAVLSLVIYPNVVYQQNWNQTTGIFLSFSIGVFLPLLLVAVYAIRKKQLKKAPESS
ncbi:endospore germination permease [Neobacillus niacini]|uniref:GerAB/ArcD/ProY family transporter n=1 Tax=Neobacillus niacini TaxID=86668 RepID=UPI00052FAC44|nr:endospore germination permease [Neobacillus niacini]KGM44796.1 spore gernimation protein [Neobacillus niacini]MEC1522605.1 endospore germination permease [Neobacillus niacini]